MRDLCKVCFLDKEGNVFKCVDFTRDSSMLNMNTNKVVPLSIYPDDTIQQIKEKIVQGVSSAEEDGIEFSLEEMYLFANVERPFVILDWYKQVTQNETVPLKTEIFCQLLVNFSAYQQTPNSDLTAVLQHPILKEKRVIEYEDILEFSWFRENETVIQKIPLGFRMELTLNDKLKRLLTVDEMFIGNPYEILPTLEIDELYRNKTPVMLENEFLFHFSGKSTDNTIYVCLAENLLSDEPNKLTSYYFPYLYKKNINTLDVLKKEKQKLLEQSTAIIEANTKHNLYHSMDIFHSVQQEAGKPFPFIRQGIEEFIITIENNRFFQTKLRVPIEAIFKNVHATYMTPYVEYYGGMKQEPMVRLLYEETSQNGDKIPLLSSRCILDIVKRKLLTRPHLIIYVVGKEVSQLDSKVISTLEANDFIQVILEQNGQIQLRGKLKTPMTYNDFETWLREKTTGVFDMINDYLYQTGYEIRPFRKLKAEHVTITSMNYYFELELTKKLDFSGNAKCLNPLFVPDVTIQMPKEMGEEMFRYKRVEHYQKMDEEDE